MTTPAPARGGSLTEGAGKPRRSNASRPKFVSGSIFRHILVMTGTGAVGLMAIFLCDLANILFLSWLGDEAIIAGVGFAGSIVFLTVSIGLGLSIAGRWWRRRWAPAAACGDGACRSTPTCSRS